MYVWGIARRLGGSVILRIEDHDRGRSSRKFEVALLDDLAWLGLEPDAPSFDEFHRGSSKYRQSDRQDQYRAALDALSTKGLVYSCGCSRREISEASPVEQGQESRYPGTCRGNPPPGPVGTGLRVIMEPGEEQFTDLRLGEQRQSPEKQCGDLLIRDRLGQWTYQFAVSVDDLEQGVDLVIRGEDLLTSTGRQMRLARLLGRKHPPAFYHHPLVLKPSGEKLSKANKDTGLAELRQAGAKPEDLLGEAAFRGGLLPEPRPLRVNELPDLVSGISSSAG